MGAQRRSPVDSEEGWKGLGGGFSHGTVRDGSASYVVGSAAGDTMSTRGSATTSITPRQLAERILREHDARRLTAPGPWSWDDDPDGARLVALAAMVTRWNVNEQQFEAKLRRLIQLPSGVAAPAAERMLELWLKARAPFEP